MIQQNTLQLKMGLFAPQMNEKGCKKPKAITQQLTISPKAMPYFIIVPFKTS